MATAATPANAPPPVSPGPRVLWPWPTFFLGIAALVGVGYAHPYIQQNDGQRMQRDIRDLRKLIDQTSGDMEKAVTLGTRLLEQGEKYPQQVGEVHYLLGCAHLRQAEDPTAADNTDAWQEARRQFEQAELAGVPEADQPKLAHRLGKALYKTKGEPHKVLEYLLRGEDNENPTDRWQLLSEVYLIQTPPQLRPALDATRNQLASAPPTADAKLVSKARVQQAEIQLRLSELQEARKTLERIDANAPPELYLKSRFLLARCYAAEGNFKQAASTLEQVKDNPRLSAAERGAAQFELGWFYVKVARVADGLTAWRQAQIAGGEAAQAAALRQAELQLTDSNERGLAISMLEKSFEGVTKPDDYHNTLIAAPDALAIMEQMCHALRVGNDFANASKVADVYARLAPPGKRRELPAEIADAWAQALLAEAKQSPAPAAQRALDEARKQLRKAGTASADAAIGRPETEQLECLRRATNFYFKAQDKLDIENGLGLLERMTKLSPAGDADSEIIFLKALAHQQLGRKAEAIDSYKKIAQQADHPNAPRARYQMALMMLDDKPAERAALEQQFDLVAEELEKNVDPAVAERDREIHELSMYLLGDVLYQRRDWLKAQSRLEAALRFYPQNAQALHARFMFGRCFWFQAAQESILQRELLQRQDQLLQAIQQQNSEKERESSLKELEKLKKDLTAARGRYRAILEKAKQPFEDVENTLMKRDHEAKLSDGDRTLLRQASFAAAECSFYGQDFDEAVRRYQLLRIRYEGQFEEIMALSQLWQCHGQYRNDLEKAKVWADALREAVKKVPDDQFDGSTAYHKREYWDNWLKIVDDWMKKRMTK